MNSGFRGVCGDFSAFAYGRPLQAASVPIPSPLLRWPDKRRAPSRPGGFAMARVTRSNVNTTPKKVAGKPAESISVTPVGVSKLNCEALCGLTERQLYELGRAHNLPRLPGKIPVYRADAVLALFASGAEPAEAHIAAAGEPTSAADVLARIGRRMGGAR